MSKRMWLMVGPNRIFPFTEKTGYTDYQLSLHLRERDVYGYNILMGSD